MLLNFSVMPVQVFLNYRFWYTQHGFCLSLFGEGGGVVLQNVR